jgi:CspA family cold shock protein
MLGGMFFVLTARKVSMAKGTVKWFSNAKGYGFIAPDEGGDDIFAHFSSIDMDGYKSLKQGQKVQYEVTQGPKGFLASSVTLEGEPEKEETGS